MKSKSSRFYGIAIGLALIVLAIVLTISKIGGDEKIQTTQTTSVEVLSSKNVRIAQAKIEQRPKPQPVQVTLGGFKSTWENRK